MSFVSSNCGLEKFTGRVEKIISSLKWLTTTCQIKDDNIHIHFSISNSIDKFHNSNDF